MTTDQLLQAINDAGLTQEGLTSLLRKSILQVDIITKGVELQNIAQDQSIAIAANTTAREAKQAEIAATQAQLLALISSQ